MVELLSVPIFSMESFQSVNWFSEHLNQSTVSPVNVQYTENAKDGLRRYDCCAKSKSEYWMNADEEECMEEREITGSRVTLGNRTVNDRHMLDYFEAT